MLSGCRTVKTTTTTPISDSPISHRRSSLAVECFGSGGHECEGIVECRDRILEADMVLEQVRRGLPAVPVESHLQYVPKRDWDVEAVKSSGGLSTPGRRAGLRILQIARVEAFGEPGVDRREEGPGLIARPFPLDLIAAGNTQPPGVRDGVCAVELHPSVATR